MKKSPAADRTLGLFTGKSKEEEANEAERIRTGADIQQPSGGDSKRKTLEEAANEWRNVAFVGQEWTSQHFGIPDKSGREYRLSVKDGWAYLEQTDNNGKGAYHYGGIMFPEHALPKLATVIVEAARAYKQKEKL